MPVFYSVVRNHLKMEKKGSKEEKEEKDKNQAGGSQGSLVQLPPILPKFCTARDLKECLFLNKDLQQGFRQGEPDHLKDFTTETVGRATTDPRLLCAGVGGGVKVGPGVENTKNHPRKPRGHANAEGGELRTRTQGNGHGGGGSTEE